MPINPLARVGSSRQWDVLRILRGNQRLTRGELGQLLGLSISQVSRLTADLIAAGLIDVDAQPADGMGRPPESLRLTGSGPWVIGMEVGGGKQRGIVANLRGEAVARLSEPLPRFGSEGEALDAFAAFAARLLDQAGVSHDAAIGLGLALYAVVDPVEGVVLEWSEEPAWRGWWRGVPLRDALVDRLGFDAVAVDDTVRMRAAAERLAPGSARFAESDYLYLIVDTGIGAAAVIGGKPYLGRNRLAGDIGHVVVDPGGAPCPCGRQGCLEAVASARAIEREAGELKGGAWSVEEIIAGAALGDPALAALLTRAGWRIGEVLSPLVTMFSPDLVVLSGSVTGGPLVAEAIRDRLRALAPFRVTESLQVVASALGEEAGELGAVLAILDLLFTGVASQVVETGAGAATAPGWGLQGGSGGGR